MDLEEETIESRTECRSGKRNGHGAIPRRTSVAPAGRLDTVRRIEDYRRTKALENVDRGKIDNQPIISEEGSAFGKPRLPAGLL